MKRIFAIMLMGLLPWVSFGQIRPGMLSALDDHLNGTKIARSGKIAKMQDNLKEFKLDRAPKSIPYSSISQLPKGLTAKSLAPAGDYFDFILRSLEDGYARDAAILVFCDSLIAPGDSLNLLRGRAAYALNRPEVALEHLSMVSGDSDLRDQAEGFSAASRILQGQVKTEDLNLLGLYDYTTAIAPRRSPLLAGAMSAVIPGAGKIYAGDLRSGVSSLVVTSALAACTVESYKKLGQEDMRTLLLGALTALFYISDIYGSVVRVGVVNQTFNDASHATLMLSVDMSLGSLYPAKR